VLFCDLVGSTEIATRLDPEEWREVVASYHRAATEAIIQFGGYVAQYLGDGVMAYFGWPEAHENNAERAVRAGLAILETIDKLNEQPSHPKLSTRVGIDSGTVVVGAGAGKDIDVFGDVPNVAARVQSAAEPDTVLITAAAQRLIPGLFVVDDRGKQTLKGIEQPLQLYRVVRPSDVKGRLQAAAAARALTPFIGRDDELRLLMTRWERALQGEGQVVLISGEGGIGKSRLVQCFRQQIAGKPYHWVEGMASPFFQNTPFYPVAGIFPELQAGYQKVSGHVSGIALQQGQRRPTGLFGTNRTNGHSGNGALSGKEGKKEQPERLAQSQQLSLTRELALAVIAFNLSTPAGRSASPLPERRRLLSTLVELAVCVAQVVPLVIAIEDLHWADPSTLELLQLLAEQGASTPLLLLCTARPEFRFQWPRQTHYTQVTLRPLSAYNARVIVQQVAVQRALTEETTRTVVKRTGGVPLFIEELTRAVIESGDVEHAGREIPATLHDSLMARLDQLGAARGTLQLGAVLGIDFTYELLHAVTLLNEDELQRHLLALTEAELLYGHGLAPDASYQFKHALIRDAAYEALLKSRRRELHTHVAQIIEERFPEQAASHPEILAYHCTEAGLIAKAVRYWRKAGQKASERSANAEAIVHLTKGIELIGTLPPNADIKLEEIRLQTSLINPLIATKGYTAPEVERACTRARALCHELGDPPQLFTVFGGLFAVYHNSGKFRAASEIVAQMLSWAETMRDSRRLMWSYYSLGVNSEAQGKLPNARTYLERSLALHDAGQRGSYGFVQDPNVTGSGLLAHVLHALGYPDQAIEKSQKALSDARELREPYTLAWAIDAIAALYVRRGEYLRGRELANELIAICTEHGFLPFSAEGHVWCGLALVQEGRGDEGIARILQGLTTGVTAIQHRLFELYLAIAYWQMDRAKEGLSIVESSLAQMSDQSEAYNTMPDLYRLKGELLLMQDAVEVEVEQFLQRAIEIARENGDKSAELQATTSLARLLRDTSRRDKARTTLAEIYNWFTEGFETADLKEAKALLDELSH
jgi:class 3 adenylate cyclase/tetratricopeptide (TPR) repeat protein